MVKWNGDPNQWNSPDGDAVHTESVASFRILTAQNGFVKNPDRFVLFCFATHHRPLPLPFRLALTEWNFEEAGVGTGAKRSRRRAQM